MVRDGEGVIKGNAAGNRTGNRIALGTMEARVYIMANVVDE